MNEKRRRRIEKNILKDRRYKTIIYNRFILTALLVLLQIVFYGVLLFRFYNAFRPVMLTVNVLAIVFVLYIINCNEKPSAKLNWVIMILIMPVFGIPLYLLFGDGRPTRKMNRKIAAAKEQNSHILKSSESAKEKAERGGRNTEVCRYLMKYADYPVYDDGEVTYYTCGKDMFKDMLSAMESAKKFIIAEYFIISGGKMWGEFLDMLLKKADEGVKIWLIFDDVGSLLNLPPKYDKYLESLHPNIKSFTFNPVVPIFTMRMNNRDHRKILVTDGKAAFTGGINLADEYIDEKVRFGKWKDTGVRVTGHAVNSFTMMFFNLWNAFRKDKENLVDFIAPEYLDLTTVESNNAPENIQTEGAGLRSSENLDEKKRKNKALIQPYDDSPLDKENVGESVYLDIIDGAEKYIYIFTPYLILDDFMRASLCNASKRGVDVRIVTPGIPDKKIVFRLTRSNYEPLLKAGVRIYEYTPGFIHAKSMVSDDKRAVVGTVNLDYRSLYLHFENAVYFSDQPAVMDVKRDSEEVFIESKEMTLENTRRCPLGRLVDSVLRVFETLF